VTLQDEKMNIKLILPIFLLLLFNTRECISEKEIELEKYRVHCTEKEEPSDNEIDPILIKICTYKNFQSVRSGSADYKGRYSYEYDLYKIDNNVKQTIKNSDLFKSGADKVEKKINSDLKQEYQENLNNPHLKDCMEWINFRHYELDEIGMAFTDNNQIEFYIDYGIGGACFNVAHSVLEYKLSDFAQYIE